MTRQSSVLSSATKYEISFCHFIESGEEFSGWKLPAAKFTLVRAESLLKYPQLIYFLLNNKKWVVESELYNNT